MRKLAIIPSTSSQALRLGGSGKRQTQTMISQNKYYETTVVQPCDLIDSHMLGIIFEVLVTICPSFCPGLSGVVARFR